MIVRVGLLDKSDNYISRLANYQNVHSNEAVQFEIYLFTEEQMLRRQMGRGGRIDVLIAEEELLQSPEEYARSMELAFWSEDKHEQMRDGCPVICRYQKAGDIFPNAAKVPQAMRCRKMEKSACSLAVRVVRAVAQ